MNPLEPPDRRLLEAAEGWIGLGNYAEANEALEEIAPARRAHPDVLQLRWRIYAHAGRWDACLDIATALTKMTPERRFGWIHRAHTLHKLGRTLEAKELLIGVVDKFKPNSTIPYHVARYACQLGNLQETADWLTKAFEHTANDEEHDRLRLKALEEPDLEPFWKSGEL